MKRLIQHNLTWRLYAKLKRTPRGNKLAFVSIMPTARNPDWHNQFVLSLTDAELVELHIFLSEAVAAATLYIHQPLNPRKDTAPCTPSN